MKEQKEYHYVYYSYEEWGRGYIGSRTCKCLPEEDIKYFGSFTDKNFKPAFKIILKDDYKTRKEAYEDEIFLHQYYSIAENPHFANRACQTSTSFSRKNAPYKGLTEETKKKISESKKGKNNPMYGRRGKDSPSYGKKGKDSPNYGKKRTKETRNKISAALTGRVITEEHRKNIRISKNSERSREISRKNGLKRIGSSLSEETKLKIRLSCLEINKGESNGNFGKTWFTDGSSNIMSFECPEGFWKGYTSKTRKTWKLTFEDESTIVTDNIREWCKNNGYKVDNLVNVKRGRIKRHRNIVKVEVIEDKSKPT